MLPGMGGGMDPRQMSMMMKKLGIDVRDIEGVQQVVVRTAAKDYVFDKATVSVMGRDVAGLRQAPHGRALGHRRLLTVAFVSRLRLRVRPARKLRPRRGSL
jgi:hypothetical protein